MSCTVQLFFFIAVKEYHFSALLLIKRLALSVKTDESSMEGEIHTLLKMNKGLKLIPSVYPYVH